MEYTFGYRLSPLHDAFDSRLWMIIRKLIKQSKKDKNNDRGNNKSIGARKRDSFY